jgi:hypothetical protein
MSKLGHMLFRFSSFLKFKHGLLNGVASALKNKLFFLFVDPLEKARVDADADFDFSFSRHTLCIVRFVYSHDCYLLLLSA